MFSPWLLPVDVRPAFVMRFFGNFPCGGGGGDMWAKYPRVSMSSECICEATVWCTFH